MLQLQPILREFASADFLLFRWLLGPYCVATCTDHVHPIWEKTMESRRRNINSSLFVQTSRDSIIMSPLLFCLRHLFAIHKKCPSPSKNVSAKTPQVAGWAVPVDQMKIYFFQKLLTELSDRDLQSIGPWWGREQITRDVIWAEGELPPTICFPKERFNDNLKSEAFSRFCYKTMVQISIRPLMNEWADERKNKKFKTSFYNHIFISCF